MKLGWYSKPVHLTLPRKVGHSVVASFLFISTVAPTISSAQTRNAADSRPTLVFKQFEAGRPIHLVAYGDTRFTNPSVTGVTNPRIRKWLAEQIGQQHPQAILLTGDTPFHGADPADWEEFQSETESWRTAGALQLPTPGNHEVLGGPAGIPNYLKNFPEIAGHRYYSALLDSVEVISLDSNEPSGASSGQGHWFAAQLDHIPKQVEFLMILYHIPWMADRQSQIFVGLPSKDALALRQILEARLPKIRARVIVLNGHIHNYERFERRNVEYVVTGGGGAVPYPVLFRGEDDLYLDKGFPVYHYLVIDVANHKLHAVMWKVKDPEATALETEMKDEFTVDAKINDHGTSVPRRSKQRQSPD